MRLSQMDLAHRYGANGGNMSVKFTTESISHLPHNNNSKVAQSTRSRIATCLPLHTVTSQKGERWTDRNRKRLEQRAERAQSSRTIAPDEI